MSLITEQLLERLKLGEREAFEDLVQLAVQEALKALPLVIDNITKQAAVLRSSSEQFYNENPGLREHKPLVAKVLEQVEAENPGISYKTLLEKTKPRVYQALQSQSVAKPVNPEKLKLFDLDHNINKL